jgi:YjbE family integral membrane protein
MQDLLTPQFLSALGQIIVIDLLLAGDNAILIAMAARRLPAELQRRAILWGTAGAVVVRIVMTLAVVVLLRVPALRLVGGAALVWIAWKLLAEHETEAAHEADVPSGGTGFAGAIRTIVIADAIMGIDNALGVGAAARDSTLLVVLGLAISIPIVVWGSSFILRWIERFPVIVYIGGAVLAWTAASIIVLDPLVSTWFEARPWASRALHAGLIVFVLAAGAWARRRAAATAVSSAPGASPDGAAR